MAKRYQNEQMMRILVRSLNLPRVLYIKINVSGKKKIYEILQAHKIIIYLDRKGTLTKFPRSQNPELIRRVHTNFALVF